MKSLMYHYVRENSVDFPFSAHKTTDDFISEITSLKSLGYVFGNLSLSIKNCKFDGINPSLVILTFDDGLKDHLNAARILKNLGVEGAVFYIPVEPYLTGNVLAVHKAQFIRSKYGGESLTLLEEAAKSLGINLVAHYSSRDERLKFKHRYNDQVDEPATKEFKRLINYYGKLGERDLLLDKIMEISDLALSFEDVYLSESEIREISSMGFEIGSHGSSHTPFSRLEPIVQRSELEQSKAYLEELICCNISSFCYPYGGKDSYTEVTLRLLREIGYENAISVEARDIVIDDLENNPYEIPRYDCNMISEIFRL